MIFIQVPLRERGIFSTLVGNKGIFVCQHVDFQLYLIIVGVFEFLTTLVGLSVFNEERKTNCGIANVHFSVALLMRTDRFISNRNPPFTAGSNALNAIVMRHIVLTLCGRRITKLTR